MHSLRHNLVPVPVAEVGEIGFATTITEPVLVETARTYVRSVEADDANLSRCISAARAACERFTNRTLAKRSRELRWERIGQVLSVSQGPLGSITEFGYVNTAGAEALFHPSDYTLEGQLAHTTTIRFREHFTAPSDIATDRTAPIFLRGVFGPDVTTVGNLPPDVEQAILWTTEHFFDNRNVVITGTIATDLPRGVEHVLAPYRHNPV
jgi:uncharacterized phiE125 gp8 family phage protein